ncbi:MAG: LacI family transcriptional regulator [Clostridiaceae bacterium]|nr:LacI family transcriptional regulator [Clostridiaceae bacterium]
MPMEKNKKIRLKDIADKLGISVNAVSLALNNKVGVSDETRLKVLRVADTLGYLDQCKASGRKHHYNNICVMLEEKVFKDTRFYPKVILGIENEAKINNYDTIINFISKERYDIPLSIERGKVDGIIVIGHIDDEYLKMLKSFKIPIILVDYASMSVNTGAVLTQNIPGAFKATEYLIKNGHRDIGFFGEIDAAMSFYERWLGFNMALKHYNIHVLTELCITENVEENALQNNYMAIADMLKDKEKYPTAWFCANDSAAAVLINALKYLGKKVPDDISVIGFDDIDICAMTEPQLTTMHINMVEMGTAAVKELLQSIQNPNYMQRHIRLPVRLEERDSVKYIE